MKIFSLKLSPPARLATTPTVAYLRASCRIRTNDPEITNHVLWPAELKRQVGELPTSHRYNPLPLLRSRSGGIHGELVVQDSPDAKLLYFFHSTKLFIQFNHFFSLITQKNTRDHTIKAWSRYYCEKIVSCGACLRVRAIYLCHVSEAHGVFLDYVPQWACWDYPCHR